MTDFERQRLARYVTDAGDWLTQIEKMLFDSETSSQAAAGDFIRVAHRICQGGKKAACNWRYH